MLDYVICLMLSILPNLANVKLNSIDLASYLISKSIPSDVSLKSYVYSPLLPYMTAKLNGMLQALATNISPSALLIVQCSLALLFRILYSEVRISTTLPNSVTIGTKYEQIEKRTRHNSKSMNTNL